MQDYNSYLLRLPGYVFKHLKELATQERVSVNQLINLAVAEKIASLRTLEYWQARAERGKKYDLRALLDAVGNEPPRAGDELPEGYTD